MSLISRGKGGNRPSRLAAITFAGTLSVYLVLSFLTALPASAVTTCTFLAPTITLTIDTDDDAALENDGAITGAVPAADVGFAVNGGAFATCGAGSGAATTITVTGTNSGSETLTMVEVGTGFEAMLTTVDLNAGADGFTLDYGSFTSGPNTIADPGTADATGSGTETAPAADVFDLSGITNDGDVRVFDTESYTWNGGDGADDFHSHDATLTVGFLSHAITVNGENGDDDLESGDGNDTINGGPGEDEADYDHVSDPVAATPDGVVADLVAGTSSGAGGSDVLVSIQNVEGTDSDDILTGNALDNDLFGNDGADVLDGGALDDDLQGNDGPDHLIGGAGADNVDGDDGADLLDEGAAASGSDVLNGGGGFDDSVTYAARTTNTIVVLGGGFVSGEDANANGLAEEGDSIFNVEDVFTGTGNDTITGSADANILDGDGGTDTIVGLGAQDDIFGGDGDDVLNGSGGFDYSHYEDCAASIVADMPAGTVTGCSTDTISNIEGIVGTDFDDTFIDDDVLDFANDYLGGEGNDTFNQGAGASGSDLLQGDGGIDLADYSARTGDVRIDIDGNGSCGGTPVTCTGAPTVFAFDDGAGTGFAVSAEADMVGVTVENVTTGSGNDTVGASFDFEFPFTDPIQGPVDNTFDLGDGSDDAFGGDGADTFIGGLGDDEMSGDDGNDDFISNGSAPDGADELFGGDGFDEADYSGRTADLNLTNNGAFDDGEFGEGDGIFGIEGLIGGSANDRMTGTFAGDVLQGRLGDDNIGGAGGIDKVQGQGGDDRVLGGRGADSLFGGPGTDVGNGGAGRDDCHSIEFPRRCEL